MTDGKTPIGLGVIGLGVMGRRAAVVAATHPRFRVSRVFDPAGVSPDLGFPVSDDARSVIEDPAVRCVYVACPPARHLEHVSAAARAGKAVFCEKPLAASIAEAWRIVEIVRETGVRAGVNFPFSTAVNAQRMAELVASGALGERIERAELTLRFARWPRGWQADATGWLARPEQGGFTREVVSHFLFIAARLFGPGRIEGARTTRNNLGTETSLVARLLFGDVPLTIDARVGGEIEDDNRLEVVGDRGRAALTDWYRLDHLGVVSDSVHPMRTQLDALAERLDGGGGPLATVEEAARVAELVETLLKT